MKRTPVALGTTIVVVPIEKKSESAGGIIIPDDKEYVRPDEGKVVSIGEHYPYKDSLSIGSIVTYNQYGGKKSTLDGVKYICLRQDELYYKVPENQ